MLEHDRDQLLNILSQVEQLSTTAQQLIRALGDVDVYNAEDQLRGYIKVMQEKLDLGLQYVQPEA